MTARRRLAAVVAALAGLALTLSGCLYAQIPPMAPDSTRSPAPVTEGIDPSLLSYYGQTLTWSDCGAAGFDCTTVTAPRDYGDPRPATCSWRSSGIGRPRASRWGRS